MQNNTSFISRNYDCWTKASENFISLLVFCCLFVYSGEIRIFDSAHELQLLQTLTGKHTNVNQRNFVSKVVYCVFAVITIIVVYSALCMWQICSSVMFRPNDTTQRKNLINSSFLNWSGICFRLFKLSVCLLFFLCLICCCQC